MNKINVWGTTLEDCPGYNKGLSKILMAMASDNFKGLKPEVCLLIEVILEAAKNRDNYEPFEEIINGKRKYVKYCGLDFLESDKCKEYFTILGIDYNLVMPAINKLYEKVEYDIGDFDLTLLEGEV